MSGIFLNNLNELKKFSNIAIYGFGKDGKYFYNLCKNNHIKISAIIDDKKNQKIIKKIKEIDLNSFDLILITSSFYWYDIYKKIKKINKNNKLIIKILNPYYKFLSYNFLKNHFFLNKNEYLNYKKEIVDIFENDSEKNKMFNILKSRLYINSFTYSLIKSRKIFKNFNRNKMYLDYINKKNISTIIDGGCFDLNILKKFFTFLRPKKIYGFNILNLDFPSEIKNKNFEFIHLALWNKSNKVLYYRKNNEASVILGEKIIFKKKSYNIEKVNSITLSDFIEKKNLKIDFIKLDIEGAEMKVLSSSIDILKKLRPQLAISIYHSKEDLVKIPLFLKKNLKNYIFKVGHYSPLIWDTILYAVPEEIYNK